VALLLMRKGITRVRPLAGGFVGWQKKGFPVESHESPQRERAWNPAN
jgi:3-mercaptopyruvate sulfurtransferase SseA